MILRQLLCLQNNEKYTIEIKDCRGKRILRLNSAYLKEITTSKILYTKLVYALEHLCLTQFNNSVHLEEKLPCFHNKIESKPKVFKNYNILITIHICVCVCVLYQNTITASLV